MTPFLPKMCGFKKVIFMEDYHLDVTRTLAGENYGYQLLPSVGWSACCGLSSLSLGLLLAASLAAEDSLKDKLI